MGPVLIKGFSLLQIVYRLFDYWYVPVLVLQQKSNYVWIRTITINHDMTLYKIRLTDDMHYLLRPLYNYSQVSARQLFRAGFAETCE